MAISRIGCLWFADLKFVNNAINIIISFFTLFGRFCENIANLTYRLRLSGKAVVL